MTPDTYKSREVAQLNSADSAPGHWLEADSAAGVIPSCPAELPPFPAVLEYEFALNTMRTYRAQWRRFASWAMTRGLQSLPAASEAVAGHLLERAEMEGHRPNTLCVAASSISFVHRKAGWPDPCADDQVRRVLRSQTRRQGRAPKQAEALTAERYRVIRRQAAAPRRGRGGHHERASAAQARADLDIALVGLMRDAMLRVSEAAALTWEDLTLEADGSGRLAIRRSKTDVEGQGAVSFVSSNTMRSLQQLHPPQGQDRSTLMFGLGKNQISNRIKRSAQEAGLGEGFSGHSPRVGMAYDLARAGIGLPSLMIAGRWRHPAMPAHYIRNETAARGAVAQYYGYSGNLDPDVETARRSI